MPTMAHASWLSTPEMPVLVGWRNKEWGSILENDPSETTDPECGTPLSISSTFIETWPCPAGAPSSVSLKYLACTSMKALPCLHLGFWVLCLFKHMWTYEWIDHVSSSSLFPLIPRTKCQSSLLMPRIVPGTTGIKNGMIVFCFYRVYTVRHFWLNPAFLGIFKPGPGKLGLFKHIG